MTNLPRLLWIAYRTFPNYGWRTRFGWALETWRND